MSGIVARVIILAKDSKVRKLLTQAVFNRGHIFVDAHYINERNEPDVQKALDYITESQGRFDVVLGDIFPGGNSCAISIYEVVQMCGKFIPSRKVFALPGGLSVERASYWGSQFQVDELLPDPREVGNEYFADHLNELIKKHYPEGVCLVPKKGG